MISIVIPVYRSAPTLRLLHARLARVLDGQANPAEIVFVNDASPDESAPVLCELAGADPRVRVIDLPCNVGQHRAVLAGLAAAVGDEIVVMDADLQDEPEAIPRLLVSLRLGGAAVFAGRRRGSARPLQLLTSWMFKGLLCLMCGTPADAGMFVAMRRTMVERLLAFDRPGPSILAMIGCTALPTASIPVKRAPRAVGRSAYSSWRRVKLGVLAIAWVVSWKWRVRVRPLSRFGVG